MAMHDLPEQSHKERQVSGRAAQGEKHSPPVCHLCQPASAAPTAGPMPAAGLSGAGPATAT